MRSILAFFAFVSSIASAQVYGPQTSEHKFSIEAQFISGQTGVANWRQEADVQLTHIFGVMAAPSMIMSYDLDPELVGGLGAIQYPVDYEITSKKKLMDGTTLVSYTATGKIILQKNVAEKILSGQALTVPLPYNINNYYDAKCTDKHYWQPSDFWYFFNPFSEGCEYLGLPPMAGNFEMKIQPASHRKLDLNLRLDLLRANNDNGSAFRIDVIHGFEGYAKDPKDYGRAGFKEFNQYLRDNGFSERVLQAYANRPLHSYSKQIQLSNGKLIDVEINSLLVESGLESKTVTFAKFFRKAVEQADVVYYTGHSGLGANLDIKQLEQKSGGFEFNPKKRQIFFFDSCSSYSYYLAPFRAEKTKARLDVVTNGLSSLFNTGFVVLTTFIDQLLDPAVEDTTWPTVLGNIEGKMDGSTYLINVGGI